MRKQNLNKGNYTSHFPPHTSSEGITLIALVITIIVMLILVAVSVSAAINGGLFGYAKEGTDRTQAAIEEEQKLAGGGITVDGKTYGSLDEYIENLETTWQVIYDKGETTTNGQLLISEDLVFDEFSLFRITVESEDFSGTVTLTPILGGSDDSQQMYMLFLVENEQAQTFSSMEEVNEKLSTIESGIIVAGGNIVGTGSVIGFQSVTGDALPYEYKIVKVEKTDLYDNLIFEGEMVLSTENLTENLSFELKRTNSYKIIGTVEGLPFTAKLEYGWYIYALFMVATVGDGAIVYSDYENAHGIYTNVENLVINKIYDIGEFAGYKEENGFEIYYQNDKWNLADTPDTEYVVPTTVDGTQIDEVWMDQITGIPTFNHVVDVGSTGDVVYLTEIVVNVSNPDFLHDIVVHGGTGYIDMTGCGDNLEFSEETLDYLELDGSWVIYVTEAVKTKYADYALIQVKSE